MINDFNLKACSKKFATAGYENFQYLSIGSLANNDLVYFFKFDFDGVSLYLNYKSSRKSDFDIYHTLSNHIEYFLNHYRDDNISIEDHKAFIINMSICKLCFEDKLNYSFPMALFDQFYAKYSNKHNSIKEFMQSIEEYDLKRELGAMLLKR